MNISNIKLVDLKEDMDNYRVHNNKNMEAIKNSLIEFKQYKPLIVQESTMIVLVGNARLRSMKDLGWEYAKCVLVTVDDETARLMRIADNRTADLSSWNYEQLLKNIDSIPKDTIKNIGFSNEELTEMRNFKSKEVKLTTRKVKCPHCDFDFEG